MKRLVRILLLVAWLTGLLGGLPGRDLDAPRASDPVRVVVDTDLVRLTVDRTRIRLGVGPGRPAPWRVSVSRPYVPTAAPRRAASRPGERD